MRKGVIMEIVLDVFLTIVIIGGVFIGGLVLGTSAGVDRCRKVVLERGYAEFDKNTGELIWVDDGTLVSDVNKKKVNVENK
jgi:hypothetical protein